MKTLKFLFLLLVSQCVFSCNDHEIDYPSSEKFNKNSDISNFNKSSQSDADADLANAVKQRYNSDIKFHGDGGYTMTFPDGTSAEVVPTENNR